MTSALRTDPEKSAGHGPAPAAALSSPAPSGERQSARASFRDPSGCVLRVDGRILRVLFDAGAADPESFLSSPLARSLVEQGHLVGTRVLDPDEVETALRHPRVSEALGERRPAMVLEHERVPFPSFAYEWPAEMLHAAGLLTIDLAQRALPHGFGVKDATPYNVLFRGHQPVFVDVPSFERREPGDPVWLAYAQFQRTFLLPLLANRSFGVPLDQVFLTRRDGLEPEDVYRLAGPVRRLRGSFASLVTLPLWLNSRAKRGPDRIYKRTLLADAEKARFILESLLRSGRGYLNRLAPAAGAHSAWSGYMEERPSYEAADFAAKEAFVAEALKEVAPKVVLDIGCNTGHFSAMAAREGARVVGIDSDPVVAGEVWRMAQAQNLDIQPLVVNLARPTPATGWRNTENPSFLERATGHFDCLLMLAVIHHLTITERIPLEDVMALAAELSTDAVIAEFVSPEDPMFRRLVRGRDELYAHLTQETFEQACARHFRVVRMLPLPGGTRCLYLLRRGST